MRPVSILRVPKEIKQAETANSEIKLSEKIVEANKN